MNSPGWNPEEKIKLMEPSYVCPYIYKVEKLTNMELDLNFINRKEKSGNSIEPLITILYIVFQILHPFLFSLLSLNSI